MPQFVTFERVAFVILALLLVGLIWETRTARQAITRQIINSSCGDRYEPCNVAGTVSISP